MNIPRLLIAIVVIYIAVFATDFLVHGVLLKNDYAASASMWRPEAEMQSRMPWLMLGQFVAAATFVLLWAMAFAGNASLGRAVIFGVLMALFSGAATIIGYAVTPMPGALAVKWVAAAVAQGIVMGLLVRLIYRRPDTLRLG